MQQSMVDLTAISSSMLGILVLVGGFVALLYTFIWLARLWWRQLGDSGREPEATEQAQVAEEAPLVEGEIEPDEDARANMGPGANYGLVLGILACLLFKASPLMLLLSAVAMFYSGRALWEGIWRFRLVLVRAAIGLVLGAVSVGLHFLEVSGQLPSLEELLSGTGTFG